LLKSGIFFLAAIVRALGPAASAQTTDEGFVSIFDGTRERQNLPGAN
jgi:hypothetical protein